MIQKNMKTFKCHICGIYLGEMEKGKIKRGSVLLCTECMDRYERYKGVADASKIKPEMPEFFNDIFKGFK